MANPFTVQPLGGLQNVQMIGRGMQGIAQNVQAGREEERRQQLMQQASEVFERGDPREIAQFSIQNPEMAETLQGTFGFSNEQTKPIVMNTYQQALANPERAAEIMQQGIQQVTEAGGRPVNMARDLQLLQQDPQAGLRNIEMGFAASAPDVYERFFGGQAGPKIGTYNPRDYTTQSFAEFQQTGDPSVLQRYESSRVIDVGGVPHLFNPADRTITPGQITQSGFMPTGQPQPYQGGGAPTPQPPAGREITAEDVAESEAEITRGREQAKQEVQAQSPQEERQRQEQARKIRNNIASAQDVITRVDSLVSNPDYIDAITGVRGKLPAIPGTTGFDAEIAFDQLKDTLTLGNLDKMSGVLSESDIKILSSAASGLEYGMSEEALTKRLNQIRSVFESKTKAEREKLAELMGGRSQSVTESGQQGGQQQRQRIRLDAEGNIVQ